METCAFNILFTKNVPHILEKIFLSLDYESYKNCSGVNNRFCIFLTSQSIRREAKSLFSGEMLKDVIKLNQALDMGRADPDEVRKLILVCVVDANDWGKTLHWATRKGHKDVVQLLLDRGADPNKANEDGGTQLHSAASGGHIAVVQLLLDRGADPNKADIWEWTPLHRAVEYGRKDVVQLLLDRGANPNLENRNGKTSISLARDTDIVNLLTER